MVNKYYVLILNLHYIDENALYLPYFKYEQYLNGQFNVTQWFNFISQEKWIKI